MSTGRKMMVTGSVLGLAVLAWGYNLQRVDAMTEQPNVRTYRPNPERGARAGKIEVALERMRAKRVQTNYEKIALGRLEEASRADVRQFYADVATAVRENLTASDITQRLRNMGIPNQYLSWKLVQISPTGGGIALEKGGKGYLRTGAPGRIGGLVLGAFPELTFLTAVNMPLVTVPAGASTVEAFGDVGFGGSPGVVSWDLSGLGGGYDVTDAVQEGEASSSQSPGDEIDFTYTAPGGVSETFSMEYDNGNLTQVYHAGLNGAGLVQLESGAGQADYVTGGSAVNVTGMVGNPGSARGTSEFLEITYQICK